MRKLLFFMVLVLLRNWRQHIRIIILFQVSQRQHSVTLMKTSIGLIFHDILHAHSMMSLLIFMLYRRRTQRGTAGGQNVGHIPCAPSQTCRASCAASKWKFSFLSSHKFINIKYHQRTTRFRCSAYQDFVFQ